MQIASHRSTARVLAIALLLVIAAAAAVALTSGSHHPAATAAPPTKPQPALPTASYRKVSITRGNLNLTSVSAGPGLTISPTGSTRRQGDGLVVPVTSGNLSLYPANGTGIRAQGTLYAPSAGLQLGSGSQTLQLTNLAYYVQAGIATATVKLGHKTLTRSAPVLLVTPASDESNHLPWQAGKVVWAPYLRQTVGQRLHANLPASAWSSLAVSISSAT